jgi:hypothetical protein
MQVQVPYMTDGRGYFYKHEVEIKTPLNIVQFASVLLLLRIFRGKVLKTWAESIPEARSWSDTLLIAGGLLVAGTSLYTLSLFIYRILPPACKVPRTMGQRSIRCKLFFSLASTRKLTCYSC